MQCGVGKVNCFSTTEGDGEGVLKRWTFEGGGETEAFKELREVVGRYEVGQGGIDGGEFKVINPFHICNVRILKSMRDK